MGAQMSFKIARYISLDNYYLGSHEYELILRRLFWAFPTHLICTRTEKMLLYLTHQNTINANLIDQRYICFWTHRTHELFSINAYILINSIQMRYILLESQTQKHEQNTINYVTVIFIFRIWFMVKV